MWHLDIPKTRQYDDGKLEVVARNSQGSASCVVELKVTARTDDHRGVLKNSPKRKFDLPRNNHPLYFQMAFQPSCRLNEKKWLVTNANQILGSDPLRGTPIFIVFFL